MTAEIPVWVNSRLRWVTGIGRKTTCDDVIAVLLKGEEDGKARPVESSSQKEAPGFAIMERWRRMERPLDGRSRILRVWNAWGDAQNEVKFTLKRVSDWDADSGRGSPSRDSCRRRKHHHRGSKMPWPPHHQTLHPRRLAQLHHHHQNPKDKLPETIERLMKLILAQGETIQSQLRKLHDRDNQIEHLEGETHRARVEALGSNYLLETYLRYNPEDADDEEEKGNDSGVVTEGGSDQTPPPPAEPVPSSSKSVEKPRSVDNKLEGSKEEGISGDGTEQDSDKALQDVKARVELFEKLVKVNKRLEREEESLVRLHIKFRRLRSSNQQSEGLRLLPDQELDEESFRIKDALLKDLERVRLELERGTREMEHNALSLAETDALLDARRHYLKRLQSELEASDKETERLNKEMEIMQRTVVEQVETQQKSVNKTGAACSSANDTDSNSDTGLSSLHSSSEEGVYVLDTLV
ncbi:hypothetical protein C0J52_02781 [Blattella germanica]|nr:hypothetical protein C0J52_02781 [Blattella germanica]